MGKTVCIFVCLTILHTIMKHSVKFSPEKRKGLDGQLNDSSVPLFADIRFAGSRMFYFTGYRINVNWDPNELCAWDFDAQRVRKNNSVLEGSTTVQYNIANKRLNKVVSELETLFEGVPDKSAITHKLDEVCMKVRKAKPEKLEFYPMFEQYSIDAKLSAGRLKRVKVTINHWKRFNSNLTFEDINSDTLKNFEKFLLTKEHEDDLARGLNTINTLMKITRSFWNDCRRRYTEEGKVLHYPFKNYAIPTEVYGDPIYITLEERDVLFNLDITNDRLAKVRDIFVFQCLVGARVGDLCKLTKSNLEKDILTYIPRKTKDDNPVIVTVPLSKKAKIILNRYDMPDGRLLPFITDQRYNLYLKELFKLAKLTRVLTRLNPTTRETEQVRICDIASSHMARRAFVGNLYGKVDSGIISSMSGHIQGSKAFTRYYSVSKKLQKMAINLID